MPLLKFNRRKYSCADQECDHFCFSRSPRKNSNGLDDADELSEGPAVMHGISNNGMSNDFENKVPSSGEMYKTALVTSYTTNAVPTLVVERSSDVDSGRGSKDEINVADEDSASDRSYFKSNNNTIDAGDSGGAYGDESPSSEPDDNSDGGVPKFSHSNSIKSVGRQRDHRNSDPTRNCWHCDLEEQWKQKQYIEHEHDESSDSSFDTNSLDESATVSTEIEVNAAGNNSSVSSTLQLLSEVSSEISSYSPSSVGSPSEILTTDGMFLEVPSSCKTRSSSVDDMIYRNISESARRSSLEQLGMPEKSRAISVDIHMPTKSSAKFEALPSIKVPSNQLNKKNATSSNLTNSSGKNLLHPNRGSEHGTSHSGGNFWTNKVDWTEHAVNRQHYWVDTSKSGDNCYAGEQDCRRTGNKKKCVVCKIIIHVGCLSVLKRINFKCKPTFWEANDIQNRHGRCKENCNQHHWVHRRKLDGRCRHCGKSFQQKFSFNAKEIIAIECSWCKSAYHNKMKCFKLQQFEEHCSMGEFYSIILPPSWVVKINKGKSSGKKVGRKSSKHEKSFDEKSLATTVSVNDISNPPTSSGKKEDNHFFIKPIPSPHIHPIVVFINPKSGGNQGSKLMRKFQALLNPRQIFDLSENSPKQGLTLFKNVPSFRVLACGGDGTVGWILATIDSLKITPFPPVAVLPLGTGNDLARTLNWGPGYTDEPVEKILNSVEEGKVIQLDRWTLNVEANLNVDPTANLDNDNPELPAVPQLVLDVFNNYFSVGADADVALQFHESREANPEKFNSRLKNKMFYTAAGGKNLLLGQWRELSAYISFTCDGVDYTEKFRELGMHCLLFLNISRYSGGTTPWGNPNGNSDFEPQSQDDGYLEVIGLTSTSLATLHIGSHGERICQCKEVTLTTRKNIPAQVDGEPCRLMPSIIRISRRNQANLVQKSKRRNSVSPISEDAEFSIANKGFVAEGLTLRVNIFGSADIENLQHKKENLQSASYYLGNVTVNNDSDFGFLRQHIEQLAEDNELIMSTGNSHLSDKWTFLDTMTSSDSFSFINKSRENLHVVTDLIDRNVYIMDPELQWNVKSLENFVDKVFSYHNTISQDGVGGSAASSAKQNVTKNTLPTSEGSKMNKHNNNSVQKKEFFNACKQGNLQRIKELTKEHVDIMSLDSSGMSGLHHAIANGNDEVAKYIIQNVSTNFLNLKDRNHGQTALHVAAFFQHEAICRMLISAGASPTLIDYHGLTPRDQALRVEDEAIASFLEQSSSQVSTRK